jgi:hypothetical protein
MAPEAPSEETLRRPRKPAAGARGEGEGAGKPAAKRSSAARKPAVAKTAEEAKPEPAAAPAAEPAKPAVKRVRKPTTPETGTEGKEQ